MRRSQESIMRGELRLQRQRQEESFSQGFFRIFVVIGFSIWALSSGSELFVGIGFISLIFGIMAVAIFVFFFFFGLFGALISGRNRYRQ